MSHWTQFLGEDCRRCCNFCSALGVRSSAGLGTNDHDLIPFACNWDSYETNSEWADNSEKVLVLCDSTAQQQLDEVAPTDRIWLITNVVDREGQELSASKSYDWCRWALNELASKCHVTCLVTLITQQNALLLHWTLRLCMEFGIRSWQPLYLLVDSEPVSSLLKTAKALEIKVRAACRSGVEVRKGISPYNPRVTQDTYPSRIRDTNLEHKNSVKWTIVIPTHNRLAYLRLILSKLISLPANSPSYEIVIVDDGSDDGTSEYLNYLCRSNIRPPIAWIHLDPPLQAVHAYRFRAGIARNLGALHANGEYLLFLDSDIVASDGLLAAHDEAHRRREKLVVIGRRIRLAPPVLEILSDSCKVIQ